MSQSALENIPTQPTKKILESDSLAQISEDNVASTPLQTDLLDISNESQINSTDEDFYQTNQSVAPETNLEEDISFGDAIKDGLGNVLMGVIAGAYAGAVWFVAALLILCIGLLLAGAVSNGWSLGAIIVTSIILIIVVVLAISFLAPVFVIIGAIVGIVGGIVGAITGLAIGLMSLIFSALFSYTPVLRTIRNWLTYISSIAISIIGFREGMLYLNSDLENLGWFMGINYILSFVFGLVMASVFTSPKTAQTEENEADEANQEASDVLSSPFKFYGKIAGMMMNTYNRRIDNDRVTVYKPSGDYSSLPSRAELERIERNNRIEMNRLKKEAESRKWNVPKK